MTWAPLLLADPSPSLRLLVLRDLLKRPENDVEVRELQQLQETDPFVTRFLDLQNEDGSFRGGEGGGRVLGAIRLTAQALMGLGYFGLDERDDLAGKTFRQVMAELVQEGGTLGRDNLKASLATFLNVSPTSGVIMAMEWLGLLDDTPVSATATTLLDVLADQMLVKMGYAEGERDMVVLVHEFLAVYPDRKEHITSTLVDYGIPGGDSSMARTVSLPAAIATRMILEEKINLTGVQIPVVPEIYEPVLKELEQLDIVCVEKTEVIG